MIAYLNYTNENKAEYIETIKTSVLKTLSRDTQHRRVLLEPLTAGDKRGGY
jgi:hypothetical protein